MLPRTLLAFALPIALCCAAETAVLSKHDETFIREAINGGLAEIRISEAAIKRDALTPAELDFAKQMVEDHEKVNKELAAIASSKNVTVPSDLDPAAQQKLGKLTASNDKVFAERYLDCQIDEHKAAIKLFEEESSDGKDPELKAFAVKHLPHLRAHLESAKALESSH